MKNKVITIIGLLNSIYNNKAPKYIKYYDATFEFKNNNYYLKVIDEVEHSIFDKLAKGYMTLNDTVEILPEENDEWEDIEEIEFKPRKIQNTINKLIKNQKYLKERIDKNE